MDMIWEKEVKPEKKGKKKDTNIMKGLGTQKV